MASKKVIKNILSQQNKTLPIKQNNPIQSKENKKNEQKQNRKQQEDQSVKQSDYCEIISQNQLIDYFKSIKITSVSQKKSDFYAYQRFMNVTEQIYNGDIEINQNSQNINPLLAKQKISEEEQKSNLLKAKKMEILSQLSLLDEQVSKTKRNKKDSISKGYDAKSLSMDSSRLNSLQNQQQSDSMAQSKLGKLILSKKQHKQLVIKLIQQRQQRQKLKQQIKGKEQQKLKKLEEEKQKLQNQKKQQERKRKLEEIQQKLRKKKQMHQKFIQKQKQSNLKVKQLKQKKFLHEQIQQRFELKIKLPFLQQQKKILRQKREFAKAYSIDQIKNHQKSYLELRQNSIQKSQAKQIVKHQQPIKLHPKSQKMQKILQEQKLQQRRKLIEKKRAIQQKIQRQQNYVEYLKQKFSNIKIDKAKQEEIKARLQKQTHRRQPDVDFKKIGMNYLSQAKKLAKKITPRTSDQPEKQQNQQEQNKNVTALSQPQKKQARQSRILDQQRQLNLLKKRQQKIQILIQDNSSSQTQRIRKLKYQTQKINQAFRMKEQMLKYGYSQKVQDQAVELLLTSIQAKMGIIDISH